MAATADRGWAAGGQYHQWVQFLARWESEEPVDPASLPAFPAADMPADVASRLADRLATALAGRLRSWADGVSRAVSHAPDEFAVAVALQRARPPLRRIRALAAHAGLPTKLSSELLAAVDGAVRSAQEGLVDQVEALRRHGADRRAVEARLRTVRDNSVVAVTAEQPAAPDRGWQADPAGPSAPPGRRIITS